MLTVYQKDIDGFGKEDWEDMLDNPHVPISMKSAWEDWCDDKPCVFEIGGDSNPFDSKWHSKEWEDFPVKEFVFDLEHEGEGVEYSRELGDLLADIAYLNGTKRTLYRLSLYDTEFAEEMDNVTDEFCGAYDRALARALLMLLKELCEARGE